MGAGNFLEGLGALLVHTTQVGDDPLHLHHGSRIELRGLNGGLVHG